MVFTVGETLKLNGLDDWFVNDVVVVPSEYAKSHGPVPVRLIESAALDPEQIVVVPVIAAVGFTFMVAVTLVRTLVHEPLSNST